MNGRTVPVFVSSWDAETPSPLPLDEGLPGRLSDP